MQNWTVTLPVSAGMVMLLAGCGDKQSTAPRPASTVAAVASPAAPSSELATLRQDNQRLRGEVDAMKAEVADLRLTPQVLLGKVGEAVTAENRAAAKDWLSKLESRYGNAAQTTTARQQVARLEAKLAERAAEAKRVEARGFYALKPLRTVTENELTLRVEQVQFGNRWIFDAHGDEYLYRQAERGERYLLMSTVVQTGSDKNPYLPDVAVYRIDGKTMQRVSVFSYEFRRWSSYGTYIGLYHDFKNDFAHTSSVAFSAAARLSEADAKLPLAVVATGQRCHERGTKTGRPEVEYRYRPSCASKSVLVPEDFVKGDYRVIAFFNAPKGP